MSRLLIIAILVTFIINPSQSEYQVIVNNKTPVEVTEEIISTTKEETCSSVSSKTKRRIKPLRFLFKNRKNK